MSSPVVDAQDVRRWRDLLVGEARSEAGVDGRVGIKADQDCIDLIGELERLKSTASALQADLAVALDASVRATSAAAGVPFKRRGRGVAAQVALARHESPHRGRVLLTFAHDLHDHLPHTRAALLDGALNEERAHAVATETTGLDHDDRATVDREVCADRADRPPLAAGLGTRSLIDEVRRRTYAVDPDGARDRARDAAAGRKVTLRAAPDSTTTLTATLPLIQGIASFATLTRDTETLRAAGDPRTKAQIMADLFVERLTGQSTAAAVPVCVDLVISDETLLDHGTEPAQAPGHGPVPARIARNLITHALDGQVPTWLRRVYATPTGKLVALSTRQRFAPAGLADYLRLRDAGTCRTPWCDAPIRHIDHVEPLAKDGRTTAANTQGLCEACNYSKQASGWRQHTLADDDRHTVETTTPTGHVHRSRAPDPPRPAPPGRRTTYARPVPMEIYVSPVLLELDVA